MSIIRDQFASVVLRSVPLMPKTFVCHASEDAAIAAELANKLLLSGFPVWLDKLCILPGQEWEQVIAQGVDSAHAIVVIISENSVDKTGFLQREIRLALDQAERRPEGAIFILPLLVGHAVPPHNFKRWQWVRIEDPYWFEDLSSALTTYTNHGVSAHQDIPRMQESTMVSRLRASSDATVDFVIDLKTGDGLQVELGVSVIAADGTEKFDIQLDRKVALRSGVAAYRRRIPCPYETGDLLIGAVWGPKVPKDQDGPAACLGRLQYALPVSSATQG